MTNKQLNGEYSMNHDQEEADRRVAELAGLIAEEALAMHTEMVSAGGVEESNDPLVMFGRGAEHAVGAMIMIQREHKIKTEEERVRAANKTK